MLTKYAQMGILYMDKQMSTQEVYEALFENIISGKYEKSSRLIENQIAEEYNTSRTPVREALRQLSQDGLVEILERKGARVVGFVVDDVEEIYEIRKYLEILALRSAIPFLRIEGLKELREGLVNLQETNDPDQHEELDTKIHNYFIQASNKKRVISVLNQMFRLIKRFRKLAYKDPFVRRLAIQLHFDLVDALAVRDLKRAETFLIDHIEKSKDVAISLILKGQPGINQPETNQKIIPSMNQNLL